MAKKQFGFEDRKRILVVGLPETKVKDAPLATFEEMGLDSWPFVESWEADQ